MDAGVDPALMITCKHYKTMILAVSSNYYDFLLCIKYSHTENT